MVPKENVSSHKDLLTQTEGLDTASCTSRQSSPLMLQLMVASIYWNLSCFRSPTWDLRRSSPHCWGQPLEESLTSLLCLQTTALLVHYIRQKYSRHAKVLHSTVCVTAFKGSW